MTASAAAVSTPVITVIPIAHIAPSSLNPRKHFDPARLAELVVSIQRKGIRSPLQVRPGKKADTFEIIAGERRWTAAKQLNLETAPCTITDCSDDELVELALTDNGQREDLTPMDEARAYRAAMKAKPKHYTVAVVAATVGKSESYVYRRLKLLDLAKPLQEALDENRLSIAHAERLVKLTTDKQLVAAGIEKGKFNGGGVVWHIPPLFSGARDEKDWKPGLEDLQPLHKLDDFIRTKSAIDPSDAGLKYLQPELAQEIDAAVGAHLKQHGGLDEGEEPDQQEVDEARAAAVLLTTDPMARMRMGLKANAPMPLTPSKWREVKPGKECEFTRPGIIAHGSDGRVLKVCIKKSCARHWPVKKKAKASKHPNSTPDVDWRERQRIEAEKREAERAAWQQVMAEALPKLAESTKGVKFNAGLVRAAIDSYAIDQVQKEFGIALTDATAAHVMLLATLVGNTDYREGFFRDIKAVAPKFLPELQRIEAAQKKAAADHAKADKKSTPKADKKPATKKGKKR